jgi:hypothetical protein
VSDDINAEFKRLTEDVSRAEYEQFVEFLRHLEAAKTPKDLLSVMEEHARLRERGGADAAELYASYAQRFIQEDELETFAKLSARCIERLRKLQFIEDGVQSGAVDETNLMLLLITILVDFSDDDLKAAEQRGLLYKKSRTLRYDRIIERVTDVLKRNVVHDPNDAVEVKLKAKTDPEIAQEVFGRMSKPLVTVVRLLCDPSAGVDDLDDYPGVE